MIADINHLGFSAGDDDPVKNGDYRPYKIIRELFNGVVRDRFNRVKLNLGLRLTKGNTIVVIRGHGEGNPHTIGEQHHDQPIDNKGEPLQKAGNQIATQRVIERYIDNKKTAAILIYGCNVDGADFKKQAVPVYYVWGGTIGQEYYPDPKVKSKVSHENPVQKNSEKKLGEQIN